MPRRHPESLLVGFRGKIPPSKKSHKEEKAPLLPLITVSMTPRNAVATLNNPWGKKAWGKGETPQRALKEYDREENQPLEQATHGQSYIRTFYYIRQYIPYGSNNQGRRFCYLQPLLALVYYILRQALENKPQETGSPYRTISSNYYFPLGFMALIPNSHGFQNVPIFPRCSILKNLLSQLIWVRYTIFYSNDS